MPLTAQEVDEIDRANASGLTPVVFIHGLWQLSSSWDREHSLMIDHGWAEVAGTTPAFVKYFVS